METQLLLKQFQYIIPSTAMAPVVVDAKENYFVADHLPIMKVNIDFRDGSLKLEANWQFLMASNKFSEAKWFVYHKEQVKIETDIYPPMEINLNDPENDGLVFPLKGNIKDGNCLHFCFGLLAMDNVRANNGLISNQWYISFYLYDSQFNDCEINFKLPLYINSLKGKNN